MKRKINYDELSITDIENYSQIKKDCLEKSREKSVENTSGESGCFIYQPNGSQQYPDFLVFEKSVVVCIETKFSRSNPVWNSGLPRPNGIYILGNPTIKKITFFIGGDVISANDNEKMHAFFTELRATQHEFNVNNMSDHPKGFAVYIRKAFEQKKSYNQDAETNFYTASDRMQLQDNVLAYCDTL